jgi:hypothetical protein
MAMHQCCHFAVEEVGVATPEEDGVDITGVVGVDISKWLGC